MNETEARGHGANFSNNLMEMLLQLDPSLEDKMNSPKYKLSSEIISLCHKHRLDDAQLSHALDVKIDYFIRMRNGDDSIDIDTYDETISKLTELLYLRNNFFIDDPSQIVKSLLDEKKDLFHKRVKSINKNDKKRQYELGHMHGTLQVIEAKIFSLQYPKNNSEIVQAPIIKLIDDLHDVTRFDPIPDEVKGLIVDFIYELETLELNVLKVRLNK